MTFFAVSHTKDCVADHGGKAGGGGGGGLTQALVLFRLDSMSHVSLI